jgi:hypothetical protein
MRVDYTLCKSCLALTRYCEDPYCPGMVEFEITTDVNQNPDSDPDQDI